MCSGKNYFDIQARDKQNQIITVEEFILNGQKYDPDKYCVELYQDFAKYMMKKKINEKYLFIDLPEKPEIHINKNDNSSYLNVNHDIILHTDYIGPSDSWAKRVKIDDESRYKNCRNARVLGGHMVWPVGFGRLHTINQARANRFALKDRIDLALLLLKDFYFVKTRNELSNKYSEVIQSMLYNDVRVLFDAFERSWAWLKMFDCFSGFCDFFALVGSFVDDVNGDCYVKNLASKDSTPFTEQDKVWECDIPEDLLYNRYAENNINAINKRNSEMLKIKRQ